MRAIELLLEYRSILSQLPPNSYGAWYDSNNHEIIPVKRFQHRNYIAKLPAYKNRKPEERNLDPFYWAATKGMVRMVFGENEVLELEGALGAIRKCMKVIRSDLKEFDRIVIDSTEGWHDFNFTLDPTNAKKNLNQFLNESVLLEYRTILSQLSADPYGGWIEPNGKIHEAYESHYDTIMDLPEFQEANKAGDIEDPYDWAYARNWVRFIITANSFDMSGQTKDMKKVAKMIMPDLVKNFDVVRFDQIETDTFRVFRTAQPTKLKNFLNESKLLEYRSFLQEVPPNAYGAWYDSKAGKIHPVMRPFGHAKYISGEIAAYRREYRETEISEYSWATREGWVRIVFDKSRLYLNGPKEPVKSFVKRILPDLKNFDKLDIDIVTANSNYGDAVRLQPSQDMNSVRKFINESFLFEYKTVLSKIPPDAYGCWIDDKFKIHPVQTAEQGHVNVVREYLQKNTNIVPKTDTQAVAWAMNQGWLRVVMKDGEYFYGNGYVNKLKRIVKSILPDLNDFPKINIELYNGNETTYSVSPIGWITSVSDAREYLEGTLWLSSSQ